MKKTRVIAFYLPQFHPIPENDEWWGKGFTEWTNVAKARPLFKGHYQPHIPADLGFYDLRVPEVREQQAELAERAGIEGFCYWHYWFAGKRLLDRPFNEVLSSGKPNFPFCLAWANETWSGIWHGDTNRILIEQTYPGVDDYKAHFKALLPAFLDPRYIKVEGKPLFYIYRPLSIPDTKLFIDTWQNLAHENHLPGIYFIGLSADVVQAKKVIELGFDAANRNGWKDVAYSRHFFFQSVWNKFSELFLRSKLNIPRQNYKHLLIDSSYCENILENEYPTIISGWDNSPRSGRRGKILINYNPETFKMHVKKVLELSKRNKDNNIVFLRAWNEWAEGNYMEPDLKYGHA